MPQKIDIAPITKVIKTEEEWRKILTPDRFEVLRHEGTERPFVNALHDNKSLACISAPHAGCLCFLPSINSTAAPVGQASGNRSPRSSRH